MQFIKRAGREDNNRDEGACKLLSGWRKEDVRALILLKGGSSG